MKRDDDGATGCFVADDPTKLGEGIEPKVVLNVNEVGLRSVEGTNETIGVDLQVIPPDSLH